MSLPTVPLGAIPRGYTGTFNPSAPNSGPGSLIHPMSRSTLYRRLRTLRSRLAIVDARLDSVDSSSFNASIALTDGLTLRGRLVREIQSLRERLEFPATTNP